MKRRKFIIKSAVGSLALGFIPAQLFSRNRLDHKFLHFPNTNGQIRHGIYSSEFENHIHVDEFLTYLEKHVFYKNGIQESQQDLINISFRFKGELHSFSWVNDAIHFNGEEYFSDVNRIIRMSDSTPHITALQLKGELELTLDNEVIVIPIKGECEVNGKIVNDKKGIVVKKNELTIQSAKDVKLVIIHKNYI